LRVPAELDGLRIVLVATRNPLNIGAVARAMSNFGVHHLRVVKPYEAAFREARSAVGASALLARAEENKNVAEAVSDCGLVVGTTAVRHRELQHPLRRLQEGARLIRKQLRSGRVAILFGSEKVGLSNQDLSHCHCELARDGKVARPPEKQGPATADAVERITALLFEALHASGYVNLGPPASAEQKLRRLVRRLNLPAGDAEVWLGMLRQILWKLRSE
jgi:tRNA C32,U32 (ribose-2'-O)-methylase TrmJ